MRAALHASGNAGRRRRVDGFALRLMVAAGTVWLALAGLAVAEDAPSQAGDAGAIPVSQDVVPPIERERPRGNVADLPPVVPNASLGRQALLQLEATGAGIPPEIADAVMAVESGYDPSVIGADGEIGLMQVLPSTARMMGFAGSLAQLAEPATNIHYGVTYLAQAWRLAGRDLCTAVMKYRAGHGETRFSYRSVDYCLKVRAKLAARGYLVTGIVPVPTFGEATGSCRQCLGSKRTGRIDIAGLNSRLNQIVFRVSVFKPSGH